MITVRSPYRISFFGGGSDYHTWYQNYGGCFLSTSIDKYCYITITTHGNFFDYKHKIVWKNIEYVSNAGSIIQPIVKELYLKYKIDDYYTSFYHNGDLPVQSGIGSSSSFACAVITALKTLKNITYDKYDIAKEAIYIERDVLGDAVGIQDQIASAFGGFNKVEIEKDGKFNVKNIKNNNVKELEKNLLLFFTGIQRNSSDVAKAQVNMDIKAKEYEIKNMMAIANNGENIIKNNVNFDGLSFGKLLHESWLLKRSMTKLITNDTIDEIYNTGIKNGAIGGKLLGAGAGGFILFYVPQEKQTMVKKSLSELTEIPFKFEEEGSKVLFYQR